MSTRYLMGTSMISMPEQEINLLRDNLLELTKSCPLEKCDPDGCPLCALRQMEPAKRAEWLDMLTEDELQYLAAYHYVCPTTKLDSRRTLEVAVAG